MSPKVGVIFYHKNILQIYYPHWVKKSVESILNQKYSDFKIYEINYGGESYSVLDGFQHSKELSFYSCPLDNHAQAMNFILDKAFEDGCDYVFNTNLDDYYSGDRIQKQLQFFNFGYDLVSSNFCYIEGDGHSDRILKYFEVSDKKIEEEFKNNNNIIAHPCVAYSKKFWENNRYTDSEIPEEDFSLWKRSLQNGFSLGIFPEYLLFYRLHNSQVTGNNEEGAKILRENPKSNFPLPPGPGLIK